MTTVAIELDNKGRYFVGVLTPRQKPRLQPAKDLEDALSQASELLTGAQNDEEVSFGKGYAQAREPLLSDASEVPSVTVNKH